MYDNREKERERERKREMQAKYRENTFKPPSKYTEKQMNCSLCLKTNKYKQ